MTIIAAVDESGGRALFNVRDNLCVIVDTNERDVAQICTPKEAANAAAWMKVAADMDYPSVWRELADAAVTQLEVKEKKVDQAVERKFRIPQAVKAEAQQALDWVAGFDRGNSTVGLAVARQLSNENYITFSKLERIARYFSRRPQSITENAGWSPGESGFPTDDRIKYSLWGGQPAREWVVKVQAKHPMSVAVTAGVPHEDEPAHEDMGKNPVIIEEIEIAPETPDGDADLLGDEPHEYVDDPDIMGECLVCGREEDDPMHVPAEGEDPEADAEGHDPLLASVSFEVDPDATYFGKGVDNDSTVCTELYKMNEIDGEDVWSMYDGTGWIDIPAPDENTIVIMLDPESTQVLADFVENRDPEQQSTGFELATINPLEWALFAAAEAEVDWELVDRVFDIYDSQERSVNAKKQVRGPGGKFGDNPDDPEAQKQTPAQTKARLSQSLPLVPNIAQRIQQYLADVAKKRGGAAPAAPAAPTTPAGDDAPAIQAAIDAVSEDGGIVTLPNQIDLLNALIEKGGHEYADNNPGTVTDVRPLYLAIVDNVDTEAVLDLISLVPPAAGTQGPPVAWKRDNGKWILAADVLADLQGTSPPPVVELSDDAVLKDVLDQVDKATADQEPQNEEAPAPTSPAPVKPDANPDQHPVVASVHPCICHGCDEFDCGDDACACCWSYNDDNRFVIDPRSNGLEYVTEDDIKRAAEDPDFAEQLAERLILVSPVLSSLPASQFKDFTGNKRDKLAKKGYALPDGSFPIESVSDLKNAISAYGRAKNKDLAKKHIMKRARALNRADLIPADWKSSASADDAPEMWGTFGELIPLAAAEGGLDRNRGNAEKLRRYWVHGEGAAKIGWGAPGDWYRCVSHLSKYLGPRAKGYCTLRHKDAVGVWPGQEDAHK